MVSTHLSVWSQKVRLKVALVTVDSGVALPFDLTRQARKYIEKLGQVAATCVLSSEEELQLLETDKVRYHAAACLYSHKAHILLLS
jgi:hypothetical protein